MMKQQAGPTELAKAAQSYMESHSRERFSLQEMADALFVNGSYLLRTFRRCMGITPLRYHHRVRCREAEELLTRTDLSISEIGETVGFATSSHFTHIFKKTVGCTPSEYRSTHKTCMEERNSP